MRRRQRAALFRAASTTLSPAANGRKHNEDTMGKPTPETIAKGNVGEDAFAICVHRLGYSARRRSPHEQQGDHGPLPDFELTTAGGVVFDAEIKTRESWSTNNPQPWSFDWQTGCDTTHAEAYAARARSLQRPVLIFAIMRGIVPREGYRRSPAGVWFTDARRLRLNGWSTGKAPHLLCSNRVCDGGVWQPFAPWSEERQAVVYDAKMDADAWSAFWQGEVGVRATLASHGL